MRTSEAQEIVACLAGERYLFHYFKDRYALLLLSDLVGEGMAIRDVRATRYAKLLERPRVRDIVRAKGDGRLARADLEAAWPARPECYTLTLGLWGSEHRREWSRDWHQMARRGLNLVLQLNFSSRHDRLYHHLVRPGDRHPFEGPCHPVNGRGRRTMAWARIDLDFATGEALIEEVQNDWLRQAQWGLCWMESDESVDTAALRRMRRYVREVLAPHLAMWDEALLAATIGFLRHELGIDAIYYYDFETGNRIKGFARDFCPPRSLYQDLPKKFCFERTPGLPEFLQGWRQRRRMARQLKTHEPVFWRYPAPAAAAHTVH